MAERWWRAYDGSIDHPKLLRLSDAMHRAWFTLQCIASANGGALPPAVDIALRLRMKPAKVGEWIVYLVTAGLIDRDGDVYRPHNWDERQYKTDTVDPTAASRAKKYRDRKRDDRDATVTHERPEAEQIQNRTDTDARAVLTRAQNFRQAIVKAFASANSPNLPETSRAELWLSQGFQEDICLAVIVDIVKRKPSITTLSYFDKPIADAHAGKAPPRQAVPMTAEEVNWDEVLTTFKKIGHWSKWAGPDLSSPACRAPPKMLEKYDLVAVSTEVGHRPVPLMRNMQ